MATQPSALADLHDHLERHFQHEESLMSASDFPPAGCHQREHASVLEVVAEVRRRYAGGERDPAARLADALVEWLELHAGSMDAALAQWLNAAREEVRTRAVGGLAARSTVDGSGAPSTASRRDRSGGTPLPHLAPNPVVHVNHAVLVRRVIRPLVVLARQP